MELIKQTRLRVFVQTRLDIARDTKINAQDRPLIITAAAACWYTGTRTRIISTGLILFFVDEFRDSLYQSSWSSCPRNSYVFHAKLHSPFTNIMASSDKAITDGETDPSLICKYRMPSMLMVLGLFPLYQHATATMIWGRSGALSWMHWVRSGYY